MARSIFNIISSFICDKKELKQLHFSGPTCTEITQHKQQNFPCLDIILQGSLTISGGALQAEEPHFQLQPNEILYTAAGGCRKLCWDKAATLLTILFNPRQIEFSLVCWDGEQCFAIDNFYQPKVGAPLEAFITQALSALDYHSETRQSSELTCRFLVYSLLSQCLDLFYLDTEAPTRTAVIFAAIRRYIDQHYADDLNRNFLAATFHLSPNYLSSLFHKEGNMVLNEYITQIRLDRAKKLLIQPELSIKDVSMACGFQDSNYFCRIFRRKNGCSPSEYRNHYHATLN